MFCPLFNFLTVTLVVHVRADALRMSHVTTNDTNISCFSPAAIVCKEKGRYLRVLFDLAVNTTNASNINESNVLICIGFI
jgi:hypothetical protein